MLVRCHALVLMSFLESLSPESRAALFAAGRTRVFPKGSTLFFEDDDAHDVLLITDGTIKVSISDESGREVILDLLGPGDVAGELSAVDAAPRSATGVALDKVSACVIHQRDFGALLESCPDAATALLSTIVRRLRAASRRQFEFGAGDALGRLCRSICDLDARFGRPDDQDRVFTMPFSQQALASHAGLSREAIVKGLASMRTLGWISIDRGELRVHDPDAVRARATGSY